MIWRDNKVNFKEPIHYRRNFLWRDITISRKISCQVNFKSCSPIQRRIQWPVKNINSSLCKNIYRLKKLHVRCLTGFQYTFAMGQFLQGTLQHDLHSSSFPTTTKDFLENFQRNEWISKWWTLYLSLQNKSTFTWEPKWTHSRFHKVNSLSAFRRSETQFGANFTLVQISQSIPQHLFCIN